MHWVLAARVYGTDAKVSDSVSTKFTNNTIQVGGDAKVGDTWIVGAAFGYTDNSTDFSNGSADSDGYTLSVYGTAVLPTGSYLDLIGRVGRISTDIDVSTVTPFKASYDNTTVGLSAEVGHRFDLSQIFYVTPQAELAYWPCIRRRALHWQQRHEGFSGRFRYVDCPHWLPGRRELR